MRRRCRKVLDVYFDDLSQVDGLVRRSGCTVLVVPDEVEIKINGAIVLQPEGKSTITIEQVRGVTEVLNKKQVTDMFVLVRPADALGGEAANAFLKNLEEPGEKVHYALVTSKLARILPTVLSRSAVYILRRPALLDTEFRADPKVRELARKLVAARPTDLLGIAEEITKKKDGVRARAMEILGVAIEILYRSYYVTGKETFVLKIPKFVAAYEAIEQNGHAKLHLVADLV